MATKTCSTTHTEESIATIDPRDEYICYNCRRKVSDLEPLSKDFAEVRKSIITHLGKSAYLTLFSQNDIGNLTLTKTWRSGGTDTWGSSWECKDCIRLPDELATVHSYEAYLRELIQKVCDTAGCDSLHQMITDLRLSNPEQLQNMTEETLSLKASHYGLDEDTYHTLARAVVYNMITQQKNGLETVFILNAPPLDDCCSICGEKAEQQQPFDQLFIDECNTFEKNTGGEVSVTHCVSPWITEDNKLAKNARVFNENHGPDTTWECTDCIQLSNEEAAKRLNSRRKG